MYWIAYRATAQDACTLTVASATGFKVQSSVIIVVCVQKPRDASVGGGGSSGGAALLLPVWTTARRGFALGGRMQNGTGYGGVREYGGL